MHTIVVIEDQPVLASAYRNKFQGEGFKVEVALDGEQGLDLITRIKPDLVLLDMHLPKLNGLEVMKTVRADPEFQALPIIIFSSLTKPGAVEEAWQAGATMVLSKLNTSPNRVLESVRTILANVPAEAAPKTIAVDRAITTPLTLQATVSSPIKGQVLLVEGHADMNALLTFLLQQAGHQVTSADNHRSALRITSEQSFDLFLLTQSSPEGGGLSLCKHLRQSCPNTPLIVYSTAALFSEQQAGLKLGVAAFLVKPEDLFNLGQIISELLPQKASGLKWRAA